MLVYPLVHAVQCRVMFVLMCQKLYMFLNFLNIFTVMGVCAVDRVYVPALEDRSAVLLVV